MQHAQHCVTASPADTETRVSMTTTKCDSDGEVRQVTDVDCAQAVPRATTMSPEIVYYGDPMCSWCWGISPQLLEFRSWCNARELPFCIVVGGLRAGGGDPWNTRFREFLRHHWREVAERTRQPFNEAILDRDAFEYDTEPACRAVVAARSMCVEDELGFFAEIQRRFYVDNEDPKQAGFYSVICTDFGLNKDDFSECFKSSTARERTRADFAISRNSGITGFPTIALKHGTNQTIIATGFATVDEMRELADRHLSRSD
jgi:putative protein-disulfide isomerase